VKYSRLAPIVALALSAACTPAARQEASSAVSGLAPVLCSVLASVVGPDGAQAGLVCADVGKALAAGLLLARAGEPSTSVAAVAAREHTCTPLRLVDVDPGRDPREFVCREAFGSAGAARLAVLEALATGHAR
jgi:hypothetical protein